MPRPKKKEEMPLEDPAMETTEGVSDVANKVEDETSSEESTELPKVLSDTLDDVQTSDLVADDDAVVSPLDVDQDVEIQTDENNLDDFDGEEDVGSVGTDNPEPSEAQGPILKDEDFDESNDVTTSEPTPQQQRTRTPSGPRGGIVTHEAGGTIKQSREEATAKHDLKGSSLHGTTLKGELIGIDMLGKQTVCVVDYKGMRVNILPKDMGINTPRRSGEDDDYYNTRVNRLLGRMIGAVIDFAVLSAKPVDDEEMEKRLGCNILYMGNRSRAMVRKRRRFYVNETADGLPLVRPGVKAEARIIAVSEGSMYVDVLGVEVPIRSAGGVFWGSNPVDLRNKYFVGDTLAVMVHDVMFYDEGDTKKAVSLKHNQSDYMAKCADNIGRLRIRADIKSLTRDLHMEKIEMMSPNTRYMGTIAHITQDTNVIFVTLKNGVEAIAHECNDPREPQVGDKVDYFVRRVELPNPARERGSVLGGIAKIIKQQAQAW